MTSFLCKTSDVPDGSVLIVQLGETEVGVFRQGDDFHVYRNYCPHQGGPACEGMRMPQVRDLIDENGLFVRQDFDTSDMHIVCPWHGYEFHLSNGEHVIDPTIRLKKYRAVVRGEELHCEL